MATFADKVARTGETEGDVIQDALIAIRNHLGMDVAYFSEFVGNESVFRRVDAPGMEHLIKPGDRRSLDDVYCRLILDGRLPQLMPDTSTEPLASGMPITSLIPIGSHVSVPVMRADGTPFGMFCCIGHRPNPSLNQRDLDTMRVFAGIAAKQVNSELEERRTSRGKRAAIEAAIDRRAYQIVLQPVFHLASMEIYAFEALCRFSSLHTALPTCGSRTRRTSASAWTWSCTSSDRRSSSWTICQRTSF